MNNRKPLNGKCYGHIYHLRNSRMGPGDHVCNIGDEIRATINVKDKHDRIVVQEKLDGTNVGVVKMNNMCIPLIRSGYVATSSKYLQHQLFAKWVYENIERFDNLLGEGERACAEWLAMAHSTRYKLIHEPFVMFDIMRGTERITHDKLYSRAMEYDFTIPHVIHVGGSLSIKDAMDGLGKYGFHGAIDPIEGAVWRIERYELVDKWNNSGPREWRVENLVKYVRLDKEDGIYFKDRDDEAVWNWYPGK